MGHGKRPIRTLGLLIVAARDALHLRVLRHRFLPKGSGNPGRGRPPPSRLAPFLRDFRSGLRAVRGNPWISLVTVLTLALGIGATSAMLSVLHDVLLRPLPYPDAERLVVGRATVQGRLNPWVTGADYFDYRDASEALEGLSAILPFPVDLTVSVGGEAERVSGNVAAPNLFAALRVSPSLGRAFRPEDGLDGAEDVVLISHGFWTRRLGGDAGVIGASLPLDGTTYTIVGVLPPGFFFMAPGELWIPMRPDRFAAASRDRHNWYLLGRLAPGITLEQAQGEVDVIAERLRQAYPETNRDKGLLLSEIRDVLTEDHRPALWILSGAALLVLLVSCGNGAAILLARAPVRRFELSIRTAIGAPRGHLVRQLLLEALALALAAGLLGILLAVWFQDVILAYLDIQRLRLPDVRLSLPVLGASLAVSVLAGLGAGVYPAIRATDGSLPRDLRSGGRGAEDGGARFRTGLVVAQVALSVVLLAASGLLIQSLRNLQSLDPGFRADGLLTAELQLPQALYPDASSRHRFLSALLDEVRTLPGVESAALTSHLPIRDFGNVYRANAAGRGEERERIFLRSVFPDYFETLGIPILSGRGVGSGDVDGSPYNVILGKTAAERLFPGEDPLGKIVELGLVPDPRPMEVVGVVGDVRLSRLEEAPEAALYVPYPHRPRPVMRLAIRTTLPPEAVAASVKGLVRRLDSEVPLSRVASLESLVRGSTAERRIITLSLSLLAVLPLILASVGLFSVLAYHVSRKRHEMGIRMALGANPAQVGSLVIRQGMGMVLAGLLLGLGGAAAGPRLLGRLLFQVAPTDPLTFTAVAGGVLGVALLASSVPVLRAARANPTAALQTD
jgi:predicted permease